MIESKRFKSYYWCYKLAYSEYDSILNKEKNQKQLIDTDLKIKKNGKK